MAKIFKKKLAKKQRNAFEVYFTYDGIAEFEGIFDSLKEIAGYLEVEKSTVTLLANAEYDKVPHHLHHISIVEIFDSRSFGLDLISLMAKEMPLAQ